MKPRTVVYVVDILTFILYSMMEERKVERISVKQEVLYPWWTKPPGK